MSASFRQTKTEQRVLQALYRLQSSGLRESGKLATYDRLVEETLASRSALLSTCQRMTKEGKIIRQKVNTTDRKRWGRRWPVGYAKRQAHFSLSPAMMAAMETRDYTSDRLTTTGMM